MRRCSRLTRLFGGVNVGFLQSRVDRSRAQRKSASRPILWKNNVLLAQKVVR